MQKLAWFLIGAAPLMAQRQDSKSSEVLPIRVEMGGYAAQVDHGLGTWRGADAEVWVRGSTVFVPMFAVHTETRPEGTRGNYTFFSYLNWSKNFYTTQGFSWSPQTPGKPAFFARYRYDLKAHYKLPSARNVVLTAGYTRFDYGVPAHGDRYSAGLLLYHKKWVVEGNGYVMRNQPGNLIAGSGDIAVQYGREGRYWIGTRFGGGRELYQYVVTTPLEVRLGSVSNYTFFRKWLSRNAGFVIFAEFQNRMDLYRRMGGGARIFVEF